MGARHLDPDKFEALLNANPQLLEVELSTYGEMFLNPQLGDILRIAHECSVVLHADNGVNLNHAPDQTLAANSPGIAAHGLHQFRRAEKEAQLGLRGLGCVRAVDAVSFDVFREAFATMLSAARAGGDQAAQPCGRIALDTCSLRPDSSTTRTRLFARASESLIYGYNFLTSSEAVKPVFRRHTTKPLVLSGMLYRGCTHSGQLRSTPIPPR